ncbi:MAG: MFS transporter [Gammaproteobacteria bacterium]|nr:MFS transporter [Gammaproteobacteria bacterium]
MKKSSAMTVFIILLAVIFIDSIGLGMIFPILAPMFMQSNSHLFAAATSDEARYVLYGITLASSYPAAMFFGAELLGEASDRHERKPVLLISLLGNVGGLIISAIGISLHTVILLIIGRLISGITAGSFPIAQAAIIDGCRFEEKAGRISIACGASAVGWMIGPVIGGIFSNENLLPQFSPALPFYIVAIICLLTALLLLIFLHQTAGHGRQESGSLLLSGLKNIIETFKLDNQVF